MLGLYCTLNCYQLPSQKADCTILGDKTLSLKTLWGFFSIMYQPASAIAQARNIIQI